MSVTGNVLPDDHNYATMSWLMRKMFRANAEFVDPVLTTGPAHGYSLSGAAAFGRMTNVYGEARDGDIAEPGDVLIAALSATHNNVYKAATNELVRLNAHGAGGTAFADIVIADPVEGWALCVPASASRLYWQNYRTGEVEEGAVHGVSGGFSRGVKCYRSGRLTAALLPTSNNTVLYVDLLTRAITVGPSITGSAEGGCLLGETGKILIRRGQILDIETDAVTTFTDGYSGYHPIPLAIPERTIGVAPYDSTFWAVLQFSGSRIRQSLTVPTEEDKLRGCSVTPSGRLVGTNFDGDDLRFFDPRTGTSINDGPALSASDAFSHSILMTNGKNLFSARTHSTMMLLDDTNGDFVATTGSDVALCSLWFNG